MHFETFKLIFQASGAIMATFVPLFALFMKAERKIAQTSLRNSVNMIDCT